MCRVTKKVPVFVFCLICIAPLPAFAAEIQAGAASSGLTFTKTSGSWIVYKKNNKIIAENTALKVKKTIFKDVEKDDDEKHYEIASLVGPVLSVMKYLYWEGGAHPGHLARLETINLDTVKSPVLLTDIFPEKQIVSALLKDKVVKKSLGSKIPKTIAEITKMADGGCEIRYYEINESFAFHHTKGDKVAVRIGLPHGCEAMRGNYTELGIYLPKPVQLSEFLDEARKGKTLQSDFLGK